ncbi:MAG: NIPSNAP family protein [Planctomycetes bacterium]|nr:NIPSNAP family protein [Planctomycetota bacterium]
MERRTFLQTTLAAGGIAAIPTLTNAQDATTGPVREFFELRTYLLKPGKQPLLDAYLRDALIPALNRSGIKQVGVFTETPAPETPAVYLLIAYHSLDQMTAAAASLETDAVYLKAAAEYLAIPATDAVYDRIESSLLHAFETMPTLESPDKRGRLFNLRIYESHNEAASKKKIEMFNKGEIAIFRRTGLTPVLFGEAILGTRIPNLTYLLAFDDDTARTEAWNKFRVDPEWLKLKSIPEYEDKRIVSKITNKLLKPTDYSQI